MLTFLFKNLLIFTQNFSLSNVEKKFFLSNLFLKKIYQFFKIWKKFMHKNAIKIVGGVKFSKKIPQNVGFFDQKVWDFWHWGGDKIVGFSASRGGFSPFNFWPHWQLECCWKNLKHYSLFFEKLSFLHDCFNWRWNVLWIYFQILSTTTIYVRNKYQRRRWRRSAHELVSEQNSP